MPKPKKRKVEPIETKESKEEEAARLMPPPPPRSPTRKLPAPAKPPASPGKQAMLKAKAETAFWRKGLRVMQRQVVLATRSFEHRGCR